jgi:hypothetical protein
LKGGSLRNSRRKPFTFLFPSISFSCPTSLCPHFQPAFKWPFLVFPMSSPTAA